MFFEPHHRRVGDCHRGHAREMRHERVPAERILWSRLRDRRLGGFKFRRQAPIGPYIADFYCAEGRLVVELDGDSHDGREEYDAERTAWLNGEGMRVVRFVNQDVYEHIDAVLGAILRDLEK